MGDVVNAEIESAAEAKRQAVRKALSEDERRHGRQVVLWSVAGFATFAIVCAALVSSWT